MIELKLVGLMIAIGIVSIPKEVNPLIYIPFGLALLLLAYVDIKGEKSQ